MQNNFWRFISPEPDIVRRMYMYGQLDAYIKGTLSRKDFVQYMTKHNMPALRLCELLTEVDEDVHR